jgi:hypothetical protein
VDLRQRLARNRSLPSGGAAEGAGGPRGNETPSAPDRFRSYSKALAGIEIGAPKLARQSNAWMEKHGTFTGADENKRSSIYALHVKRVMGEIEMAACKQQVEEIISK